MRHSQKRSKYIPTAVAQKGVMLLEALIAILVFSLGILAMVGMQAVAIGHSGQAKYRADASFAVNKLFAMMWVDTDANMNQYATSGARFTTWKTDAMPICRRAALLQR
jgi:type IV pilus modification protein PilV